MQKQPEKYNDRVHKSAHFLKFKNLIASPTSSVCAVKERRELKVGGGGEQGKRKRKHERGTTSGGWIRVEEKEEQVQDGIHL